ncbi:hypothetical protein [Singulisphaera sp. PoT]|uniref:hypothetical protein n=1 Tax=Singulisphaera sp. PoT TaxID=3411797 RepID=UPI003BF4DDFD
MASETKIELFGRSFAIAPGILVEPASEGRVVLWLPGRREGGFQSWERIASIAGSSADADGGLLSVPVVAIEVRQALGLSLGKLARKLMSRGADHGWTLPNGESGEQVGAKRTDRRLVWAEAAGASLDVARIRGNWAQSRGCQEIGAGLFLISGIEFARPQAEVASAGAGGALPPPRPPGDRRAGPEGRPRPRRRPPLGPGPVRPRPGPPLCRRRPLGEPGAGAGPGRGQAARRPGPRGRRPRQSDTGRAHPGGSRQGL